MATDALWELGPLVPVTVIVVPGPMLQLILGVIFRVEVTEPPAGTCEGFTVKVNAIPDGPVAVRPTLPAKLLRLFNVTVTEVVLPAVNVTLEGLTVMLKSTPWRSLSLEIKVDQPLTVFKLYSLAVQTNDELLGSGPAPI
jgi:hypothetical protein